MNLGDLEFKAEDFYGDGIPPTAEQIAKRANQLLAEKLEKAPLVEGFTHPDGYILMDRPGDMRLPAGDSKPHTARLVCIEELPKNQ